MKNIVLLVAFIIIMVLSLVYEPISDSIDVIAGATNSTYQPNIDQVSGATQSNDEDEDDDEGDESDEQDDD